MEVEVIESKYKDNSYEYMLKISYAIYCLAMVVMSVVLYFRMSYLHPFNLSPASSSFIFLIISVISITFSRLVARKKTRLIPDLLLALIIPYIMISVFIYGKLFKVFIAILSGVSALASIYLDFWIWSTPIKKGRKLIKRIKDTLYYFKNAMAFCFLPFAVFLIILLGYYDGVVYVPQKSDFSIHPVNRELLEEHLDILNNIRPEVWVTCSNQERINTLQYVVLVETAHLDMMDKDVVPISAAIMQNYIGADYSSYRNLIRVNVASIDNHPTGVLKNVIHECRHVWQHYYADKNDSEFASRIRIEQKNYISSGYAGENYEKYKNQAIESDARGYADYRINDYMHIILSTKDLDENSLKGLLDVDPLDMEQFYDYD